MSSATITKILDGPRNAVFHVAIVGTAAGELTDEVIIDPTTSFDPALPPVPIIKLEALWYDLTGFSAWLEYDQLLSDTPLWTLSESNPHEFDFSCFGGLFDRSIPLDGTGKLLLSTKGLGDGDRGTFIVRVKK